MALRDLKHASGFQTPGSLKTFHVFFIIAAWVVALAVSVWAFAAGHTLWAIVALLVALALLAYERWFEQEPPPDAPDRFDRT